MDNLKKKPISAAAFGFPNVKCFLCAKYPYAEGLCKGCFNKRPAKPIDLGAPDDVVHPITEDQIIYDVPVKTNLEVMIEKLEKKVFPVAKKVATSTKYPAYTPSSYSWTSTRFKDGYMQPSGMTSVERYPKMYDSAAALRPAAKRVLSFGCSTGEEVQALAKRFPDAAQLIGVDIDYNRICTARRNNKQANIYFHDNVGGLGQFDVVTAFNVFFCLEKPIPKEQWEKTLEEVAGYVSQGGLIMVFKSDYDPMDKLAALGFKAENTWMHTHNRNNKDYYCGYYGKKGHKKAWWKF